MNFDLNDLEDLGESDENEEIPIEQNQNLETLNTLEPTSSLLDDPIFQSLIKTISNNTTTDNNTNNNISNSLNSTTMNSFINDEQLFITANNYVLEIDNQVLILHKKVKDLFSKRFPELESLIQNPLDYVKTVKLIGNSMDISTMKFNHLPLAISMIVTLGGSKLGSPMSGDQLSLMFTLSDSIISLDSARTQCISYVETRMHTIAPNLSAIIGSHIAAKLISLTGGLSNLLKVPSCDLQVLGKNRQLSNGLSSIGNVKHAGYIYYCDTVAAIPTEYKQKAVRLIAAKCALALRIDFSKESPDGIAGMNLKNEIDGKIDKMIQPLPVKNQKALPLPIEEFKKKRGGKKVRKQKEKFAMTDLRRAQNRVVFGVAEEEIGEANGETMGLGLIGGSTGKGKLRATNADPKNKLGLTKKYKAITQNLNQAVTSGFQTSLQFTPVQGLALENPNLHKPKDNSNQNKWF